MAAYTSLLLVIALCAAKAYSLRCYTCELQSSNANCMTVTTCSNTATSCQTTVATAGGISSIIKRCVDSCTPLSTSISGVSATNTCCNTDLCNTSGGATITSSYTAIILALGAVLTVLKSSML
ncbi:ly6/PLAUR domain-containing protein 2-like [Dendropsophus ebraccatus]|uniref:ly6/PLAUR domain-containing protein 2-like n=1 Tax=Dendropsophus ebraccatus TaxID=150705 RepID=UPI0038322305